MDRRAIFFFASAALCGLLLWPTPAELEWVGIMLAVWLSILGIASWLDDWSRRRTDPARPRSSDRS